MNHLLLGDGDAVIKRILGEVRQGRPLGTPYFVLGIVDQVCAAEGCSVSRAAQIVAKRHGTDFNITAQAIRTMHSTFREEFALFRASKYVPGERLTRDVWRR